ncbi:S-layer homology domain-containing protein [Schnuerera sp.]|uniref:S-layer homology domain-containing protein n=1 Tax=Schnuerera sp. TaxID=2794844 RepID=UPI002D7EBDFA|nr:S-layer homology domain-containing protein [Schnuerera sp.]
MRNNKFIILLCVFLLIPSFILAESPSLDKISRVVKKGYMGQGSLDLDQNMNRGQLATIAVRLLGLEEEAKNFKGSIPFKDVEKFQGGWATPYVAIAYRENIIQGINPTTFDPQAQVSYIEILTIFMRILGYQDGIDFVDYPEDYYIKAVELGLGNLYSDIDQKVTRGDVALTIEQLLDLPLKDEDITLLEKLDKKPTPVKRKKENIRMTNKKFNTTITGMFTGRLKGREDFSKYKVQLVSKENRQGKYEIYDEVTPEKDGVFKIWNFDISWTARYRGYRYKVYDDENELVLEGKL